MSGARRARLGRGAALASAVTFVAGCGNLTPANGPEAAGHPLIGAPAPDFELEDVTDGGEQSLAAYAGRVVVVDFWATWCKPCRESFPVYQHLLGELGGSLVVIGVSQDDSAAPIAPFKKETAIAFPLVWDSGQEVAKRYKPLPTMPTAFVVDKNGVVRFVHEGYREGDGQQIAREVRKLSAE